MSTKADAAFREWLEAKKKKIDPKYAEAFDKLLEAEELRETFRGNLREADYYRRLNELNEQKRSLESAEAAVKAKQIELNTWWQDNSPKNERLKKEKAELLKKIDEMQKQIEAGGVSPSNFGLPTPKEVTSMDKEEINELKENLGKLTQRLETVDRVFPEVLRGMAEVSTRIAKENWQVSPSDVLKAVFTKQISPEDAFDELTAEEQKTRAEKRAEERKKEWMEEGAKAERAKLLGSPDNLARPAGPSIVDALRGGSGKVNKADLLRTAAEEFRRLQAEDPSGLV